MAETVMVYPPHIMKTPGVRAGKACIGETRIAVVDIVIAYQHGISPEEITTYFSSRPLTLGEVHLALAHHYDHSEELEDYRRRSEDVERDGEILRAKYLRRKP